MTPPTHSPNIKCPVCTGALTPRSLECRVCDIQVEGRFGASEFAALSTDDLHFLRIFIHCEGRIRDMESALGVSYPTVKARLQALKDTLGLGTAPAPAAPAPTAADAPAAKSSGRGRKAKTADTPEAPAEPDASAILDLLEKGDIDYDEAMQRLKGHAPDPD